VSATGPGNRPAFRVLASGSVRSGFRTRQKPDLLCLGGVVTQTGHKTAVFWLGWNRTAVPYYSSYHSASSLTPIQFLGSDWIMTWSVHRLCSFSSSFTSRIQNCDTTNIRWVAVKWCQIRCEIRRFSTATQPISVASQFRNQEVKEHLIRHNLRSDHVTIRSELRHWIGVKVVRLKCRVLGGKTSPITMVRVFVW